MEGGVEGGGRGGGGRGGGRREGWRAEGGMEGVERRLPLVHAMEECGSKTICI